MNTLRIAVVYALATVVGTALSADVNVPHEFKAGEKAVVAEVNANFKAVADGVSDNDRRIGNNTAALSQKQDRINGSCAAGSSIRVIHADGEVDCEIDDASSSSGTITSIHAVNGLTGGGDQGQVTLGIADNGVGTLQISDRSVTSADIADSAVQSSHIAESSVDSSKIYDGSITEADIGLNAVGSNEIINGSITHLDIGPNAVGDEEIIDNLVSTLKIQNNTVSKDDIGPDAVGTDEIVDNSVTAADIADGTITDSDISATANIGSDKVTGMPGVDYATAHTSTAKQVGTEPEPVTSISITAPTSGQVLVSFTGMGLLIHTNSMPSWLALAVTTSPTPEVDIFNPSYITTEISPNLPDGGYTYPMATQRLFSVDAGTTAFYLYAQSSSSLNVFMRNTNIVGTYFPVRY